MSRRPSSSARSTPIWAAEIDGISALQRSASAGVPGASSSVERALAKAAKAAAVAPVHPPPRPALQTETAALRIEPAVPRPEPDARRIQPAAARPEAAPFRLEIDSARLARACFFTPDSTLNRTTEEFRLIKRAVLERAGKARADGAANAHLVMVTSTREGEGKTFVALNLAFSLAAEQDRAVLLIDADPAKSSIARHLRFEVDQGLTDLLREGGPSLADLIIPTSIQGLSILPSGQPDHLEAELFASDRMGALLQTFCRAAPNSIVILDAPPVLATSEPSSLARHVDQTVLVVEADRTSRAAITEALNLIAICPHIGLVLNKARFRFGAVRFGAYYKPYYRRGRGYAANRSRAP
jgi:receptor protein-tyrosine kinase